jgi:hypothetical protein
MSFCKGSLVDNRRRDFAHQSRAPSSYRMERPTCIYGGPSPRIRAFASQEQLTRRKSAVSFGVSRRSALFSCRADWRFDSSGGFATCLACSIFRGIGPSSLLAGALSAPSVDEQTRTSGGKKLPGRFSRENLQRGRRPGRSQREAVALMASRQQ